MKIVSIVGSKKENSRTESLLDGILKELQDFYNGYEIEKISFRKYKILDCIGCERCFKEGLCPLDEKDDLGYVKKFLENADIVFFGSPVYLNHVSGTMKTFFDRLAYKTHQMKLAGKVGFCLTTTSSSGGDVVKEYLNLMQLHLGINSLKNYIYTSTEEDEKSFVKKTSQSIIYELVINKSLHSFQLENLYSKYKMLYESMGYGYKFERKYWGQEWIRDSNSFYDYAINNRKQMKLKEFEFKVLDNNKILDLVDEKIPLTLEQKSGAVQVIENYFNVYLIGKLAPEFYLDFLLVLVESYPLLKDKAKWEEIGYRICSDIKDEIEEKGISEYFLGMIGGFGYKAYLVNCYSNATGNLIGFSKSLNELLLDCAYNKAKKYMELNKITNMKDYDLVYGLSGNLYYLLDFEWDCDQKEKIEKVIEYLIGLTKTHKYKGNEVINFHITREEQFRDDEKENYPDGNLNFGISHGMLGPLIALTKAHKLGYNTTGIDHAINKLFLMYEVYKTYHDEIPIWPTQLTYKAYATKEFTEYNIRELRASWCYGNIGIVRGLYKASEYMNDSVKMKLYSNELIKIIDQELENYHLNIPVLCHGYASVLAIQFAMYKSIQNDELLKKKDQNLNMILLECLDKDEPDNIDNYLNNVFYEDMSLLQGAAGIVLSLLSIFKDNMYYEKIIMID